MDDFAPVGAWLLLSGTWELDASLLRISGNLIGLSGCSNQSPSNCTHRQGKDTSFFASLKQLQTKNNSWGGTKDESHSLGIFWTGHGWC